LQLHPCLKINNAPSSGTKKLQNVTAVTQALSRFWQDSQREMAMRKNGYAPHIYAGQPSPYPSDGGRG
jgi:hypothetical protein